MNPRKRPTAADVAAIAGVSRSTVSYILNGSGRHTFPEETIDRVRSAADQLGYTPQAAARALRRGRSGIVLLAVPDVPASSNFSSLVSALTYGVRRAGRSLTVLTLGPSNRLRDVLRDISPSVILELLPLPEEDLRAARAAGVQVLSLAEPVADLDREAGALQVAHLAETGRERIAILSLDAEVTRSFAEPRVAGALAKAAALELPPVRELRLTGAPHSAGRQVEEFLRSMTENGQKVDAMCCFNDTVAAVVATTAIRLGLRVPEDLAVVGMDDDPLAALLAPSLSTVAFDYAGIGTRIEAVLRVELDDSTESVPAECGSVSLVRRASS
ncbi:LacI family DNA-binding transcriptional regulator [Actinomyces culturomici]|uniref:LacI family DNA-binding transcriptional regulator n=1 Tax=Actinomyces culturomici TaxID=1926276 RepID=UPI000E20C7F6|nr:LacI family DNA-binding transcriptional regulator [Actinomyces culturomici]